MAVRTLSVAAVALAGLALSTPALAKSATPAAAGSTQTFETDAPGAVPAGCATTAGMTAAAVSAERGQHSRRSLRVQSTPAGAAAGVDCARIRRTGADLRFAVYPAHGGVQAILLGHLAGITGDARAVYQVRVDATGAVDWFDVLGWTQLAPPGTVPAGRWSDLRLRAAVGQDAAGLWVGDHRVGDAGPVGVRAVADLTGYRFATGGTGDEAFVDNVALATTGRPRPHAGPFAIGRDVTIDQAATERQMPNTSVVVPGQHGPRVLVSYPAHTDASDTAGNRMAASDDGGRSWSDYQAHNPLPDAPSYGLTRLRNGDLLAVDYHTYMTPGSGDLRAEVPTAISHDNGRTWTQRAGIMTAPQPMRNISDVTDRPGHPLGGFVLVHSVVEDRDGTLYQSGYGYYAPDKKYRQIVMTSTDAGANWTIRSTVAVATDVADSTGYEGPCEGALIRAADGGLFIVMRTGSYHTMYTARSYDNGATWTPIEALRAGPDRQPVTGIYPALIRTGGSLVLMVGRPGLAALRSPDGSGRTWSSPQEVDYRNDGNGTLVQLDRHRLLAFGDRGADWSQPRPDTFRIWARTLRLPG